MSIKAYCCPVSKHPIVFVLEHVPTQIARFPEAGVALQAPSALLPGVSPHVALPVGACTEALHAVVTSVGLLPGVSPHVDPQLATCPEVLHALVTSVGLLPGVSPHVDLQVAPCPKALHALVAPMHEARPLAGATHVDGHLGIVGKTLAKQDTRPALVAALMPSQLLMVDQPLAMLPALGRAVVRGQRAQVLQFGHGEGGVMAVCKWALSFSMDAQDPQLPILTGHVGGARGLQMQTIQGGAAVCAAVSKVIAVFCRGKNKERAKVIVLIHYLHEVTQYVLCEHLNYILTFYLSYHFLC